MMNININGEGHNIQPDTRFHYENQGLKVDVEHRQHSNSRNYDIIDKSLSKCDIEGLKGLEYNTNVPTNTPNVKERGSGRGI